MDLFIYKEEEFYLSRKLDLFSKKKKSNICTFQIKANIKSTLFIILYWQSYEGMFDTGIQFLENKNKFCRRLRLKDIKKKIEQNL